MKSIFVLLITILISSSDIVPQAPDTLWTKKFGGTGMDVGNEIIQTSDGGFAVAGYTTSFGVLQRDAFIVRLDSLGNIIWQKTYGGNLLEQAYSIKETNDNGFIISAFRYSTTSNLWLIKIDFDGDTLWTKNIGYNGNEFGTNLQVAEDGGFLLTGYTDSDTISNGDRDVWLIKFDSDGNKLWERNFGGDDADEGLKLLKLANGNLLIAGYSESFSGGDRDGWIVKTDSSGIFIWSTSFGSGSYDDFTAAAEDDDGNLYFTGTTESSGDRTLWIVKTDSAGNHILTKTYGGTLWEWGHDIKRTTDGNFILTGYTQSNSTSLSQLWILKINEEADTLWTKLFTSANGSEGYSIVQTTDNGFAVTGTASSSVTGPDVWVIRLLEEGVTSMVEYNSQTPGEFYLEQNYPNPFNPKTNISWQSPIGSWQTLKVYDVLGNEVATLVNEYRDAGSYEIEFNASQLASGVYFYRIAIHSDKLKAGEFVQTKKMLLLK